jgi:hypothetical protein
LIERDPGSYVTTARWIATEGSLEIDIGESPFVGQPGVSSGSSAVYELPGGVVQFQFSHFAPALYALAQSVGGDDLMFRAPLFVSALALMCFFAVALCILKRPWLALSIVVALGICLPQIWFSRDMYSEIPMQALLLGGLWLLASLTERVGPGPAFVTGVAFGAMPNPPVVKIKSERCKPRANASASMFKSSPSRETLCN